jgi:hypothetical protein
MIVNVVMLACLTSADVAADLKPSSQVRVKNAGVQHVEEWNTPVKWPSPTSKPGFNAP